MMQPIDPLSQLALCCGFRGRRRYYKGTPNYYYSPSIAHLEGANHWALNGPYIPQSQPQAQIQTPYLLLTQPVIIAGNSSTSHQSANTMALIPAAQNVPDPLKNIPMLGNLPQDITRQPQAIQSQPSQILTNQYAIYGSTVPMQATGVLSTDNYDKKLKNAHARVVDMQEPRYLSSTEVGAVRQFERPVVTLNSEIFHQLEIIEKQKNLSQDMEMVERHGVVITRAIDPQSLAPYLTESTIQQYHRQFLFSDDCVIRFIEIIKRPGQTLGLYIRTVQFEDPITRLSRAGLVVTKIDSDSPIYNSQVLHVGDEIISVSLINVEGMSLDDVVIIMSIPKRLVLALRIPKYRDHLLAINLSQQKHKQHNIQNLVTPITPKPRVNNLFGDQLERHNFRERDELFAHAATIGSMSDLEGLTKRQTSISQLGLERQFDRVMSGSSEQRDLTLSRVDSGTLHFARPVRIQSAINMDDVPIEGLPMNDESLLQIGRSQPRHYEGWLRSATVIKSTDPLDFGDPRQALMNEEALGLPSTAQQGIHGLQQADYSDDQQQRREPTTIISSASFFKSKAEDAGIETRRELSQAGQGGLHDNFELGAEIIPIEQKTLSKRVSSIDQMVNDINSGSEALSLISSTLPRRTLPTRPDPSIYTPTKQSVLSNLRLGDTPESSSYFSSSIEAINRELREMRRQRMALSNEENSADTSAKVDL